MSSVINPAMQSVVQSFAPQAVQQDNDRNREETTKTSVVASSVNISSHAQNLAAMEMDLAQHQIINPQSAVEKPTVENRQDNQGAMFAANLQAQANFNAQQISQANTETSEANS